MASTWPAPGCGPSGCAQFKSCWLIRQVRYCPCLAAVFTTANSEEVTTLEALCQSLRSKDPRKDFDPALGDEGRGEELDSLMVSQFFSGETLQRTRLVEVFPLHRSAPASAPSSRPSSRTSSRTSQRGRGVVRPWPATTANGADVTVCVRNLRCLAHAVVLQGQAHPPLTHRCSPGWIQATANPGSHRHMQSVVETVWLRLYERRRAAPRSKADP